MDIKTFMTRRWVKDATSDQIKNIIRRIIGIGLILCLGVPFFGFALMLLGVILIAPDVAGGLSRPAGQLFWSNRKSQPHPLYSQAEALIHRGNFTEAEKAYEKIIGAFPQEVKAHAERLRIASVETGDFKRANELFGQSMQLLKSEKDQDQITMLYHSYLKNAGRHIRVPSSSKPICAKSQ